MPKDRRIRLTDMEIKLTRDALAIMVKMAEDMNSPAIPDLRAIFARFDNIKTGGQRAASIHARRLIGRESCQK